MCIAHVIIDVIGINGESSFEQSLLKRAPGCEVWGYDFSVNGVRVFFSFMLFRSMGLLTDLLNFSGDPRLRVIQNLLPELTSNPGRLVEPTCMGKTTIPSGGRSIRS